MNRNKILDQVRKNTIQTASNATAENRIQDHPIDSNTQVLVKIETQIGTHTNGDRIYKGRVVNPYDIAGTAGTEIKPITALNEYRLFAGDLAVVTQSTGGFRVVYGGRYYLGENGYGYFYAP